MKAIVSVCLALGAATSAFGLDCAGWNTKQFFSEATAEDVAACLNAGTSPSARMKSGKPRLYYGFTPLHWAAGWTMDLDVVFTLLGAGADPNARSRSGDHPLHLGP